MNPKILPIKILNVDHYLDIKLSLDVELTDNSEEKPPSKSQLTNLAKSLYKRYKGHNYKRVFICYYLPGMIVNRGAWTTTHFNPELEVRISHRTVQETENEE